MTAPTSRAAPEPAPSLGARGSVLAAAVCGALALFSTALVASAHTAAFAFTCVALLAAAAWAPVMWPSAGGTTVRRMLSFVLLAVTLVLFLVSLVRMSPTDAADLSATFGGFLGQLLISVLVAQLLVTDTIRDLRVALLLAGGMFVLALANDPGSGVVAALLVGWPSMVTALAFDHAAREQAKADTIARAAPSAQRTGWPGIGWFAAVSGLVAVLLVLVLPHPAGVRAHQAGGASGGGSSGPSSGAPSRSAGAYTAGTLDMRARGDLPGIEVADVPIDSPVLWRGAVLDYYDGTSWSAPADGSYGRAVPGGPHFDLPSADTTFGTGVARRDVVLRRSGFSGVLLAPGQPTAVDVSGGVLRLSGGFFVSAAPSGDYPDAYAVSSTGTDLASLQLARTPVAMPAGQVVPGYALQLPASVPDRVRLLGQRITRWAPDRDAATRAVETYLRGHATYRLDSPVPPPDADAVDHFLFVAHTGFCEQFAAAEVVLLRASGVPARLATGFAGGQPSGDHRTLHGTDAHAWVEVWYPGIGWAASDPTAGTRRADTGLRDAVMSSLRDARGRLVVAGTLVVVAALVALAVWWLGGRARRRARRRAAGGDGRLAGRRLPPVLAAFDRLQRALDAAGTPRAPAESIGELARRPAMREVAAALAVVEQTSYAARAPAGTEIAAAVANLDELTGRIHAESAPSEA